MKKLFNKFKIITRKVLDAAVRTILLLVYFVFITPFAFFILVFKDYLSVRKSPSWTDCDPIVDNEIFLRQQ